MSGPGWLMRYKDLQRNLSIVYVVFVQDEECEPEMLCVVDSKSTAEFVVKAVKHDRKKLRSWFSETHVEDIETSRHRWINDG